MNKYQEALRFLKKAANNVPVKFVIDEFCERCDVNLSSIQELVDKDTPKKPHKVKATDECSRKIINHYCAMCDHYLSETFSYCPNCGQAIDWSEEK